MDKKELNTLLSNGELQEKSGKCTDGAGAVFAEYGIGPAGITDAREGRTEEAPEAVDGAEKVSRQATSRRGKGV